ncbi:dienelactone hydrolase family protein [Actinomycetes bacterium M1A6_2h]
MADIALETPTDTIDAVLEVPSGAGPWPGVVIVHDAFGLTEDDRNIARRFADQGYVTMVPNLYARGGFARCVTRVFREMLGRQGRSVDDLLAARDALAARGDTTGTVGIVGFCMGGGFALALAPKGFGVSAPFYGQLPKDMEESLTASCPVVASFGKKDISLKGAGPKLEKVLQDKGIEHDVKTYEGAGHSFANQFEPGIRSTLLRVAGFGYKHDQAEDAFARVFAFFDQHLKK